jgi:hypothetical protein
LHSRKLLFADDQAHLTNWLNNVGVRAEKPFLTTRLTWPDQIPAPEQYPTTGRDIIDLVGGKHIEPHLQPGCDLPLVLGYLIEDLPIFIAAAINGASEKFLQKGFRSSHPRPARLVAMTYALRPISAISVERVDAKWVHGRNSNQHLDDLAVSSVAIVGCGAIGGYLARGLAQAGVGSLTLIDHDELKPENIGRHVLGAEWLGQLKVRSLARQIRRDFPHIRSVTEHTSIFQDLSAEASTELAGCDVLVLAGVGLDAELAVDRWIASLDRYPARVWTWTEEFALAGHAVALLGKECMTDALDEDGRYRQRLIRSWESSEVTMGEAGCGVSFQPYDAVDMLNTVVMAQRLITDVLLDKVPASTDRIWLGNRDKVVERGGDPGETFDRSYCEVSQPWMRSPWDR